MTELKRYENAEIEAMVRKLWTEGSEPYSQEVDDVEILFNEPDRVLIEISAMYESPPQCDSLLAKLGEFFGTKNVDIHYDIGDGGCESCDYGSRYGFAVQLWPSRGSEGGEA